MSSAMKVKYQQPSTMSDSRTLYLFPEILAELAFTNTEELLHINITKQRRKTLALPLAVNIIGNFLMKRAQINESYSIDTYVSHLPEKEGIKVQSLMTSLVNVDTIYAMIIVHICFFFLIPVLKEAISGVKHLQLMTGVSPITYWISTFFFDFAFFTLLSIICTSAMAIFWNYNFNAIRECQYHRIPMCIRYSLMDVTFFWFQYWR